MPGASAASRQLRVAADRFVACLRGARLHTGALMWLHSDMPTCRQLKSTTITCFALPIATAAILAGTPAAAEAAQAPPIETSMQITGYDRAAAEAHGYKIVVDRNGVESSVPVTAQAREEQAAVDRAERLNGRTTAVGTCGKASLTTKPIASQGKIAIATSYQLSGGKKSFGHLWKVTGQSRLGTPFTESFSGANNLDSAWSATHARSLYGFSHGTNSLHLTNHAKLTNGAICTAKVVVNSW